MCLMTPANTTLYLRDEASVGSTMVSTPWEPTATKPRLRVAMVLMTSPLAREICVTRVRERERERERSVRDLCDEGEGEICERSV